MPPGRVRRDRTVWWRLAAVAGAASWFVIAAASPAAAHGGSSEDDASNYRSRVRIVDPTVPDLSVEVIDNGSRLQLDYRGDGVVVVLGYRGEPYLRVGSSGVEQNLRSPATYLNETLDASAPVPEFADPQAEPEWQQISTVPRARWHDHRAHWMSAEPPPAVQAEPGATYVIFDPWVVSILVDGRRVEVRGDLVWVPPPRAARWWAVTFVSLAVALVVLIRSTQLWLRVLGLVAGVAADLVGTTGRFIESSESAFRRFSLYLYAVLIVIGIGRGIAHTWRREPPPVLAIGLAGLVLAMQSGVARISSFSYSQLPSSLPTGVERAATVVCMVVGWALLVDFLWYLLMTARPEPAEAAPVGAAHDEVEDR
jgi:hypothetical protein